MILGRVIDKAPRLPVALTFVTLQKVATIAISMYLWQMNGFNFSDDYQHYTALNISFWMVVVFSVVLRLSNLATQIVVEKDWILVISRDKEHLSILNSRAKRVDLLCKLLAPFAISGLISVTNMGFVVVTICGISTVSALAEISLLVAVYKSFPCLSTKAMPTEDGENSEYARISLLKLVKKPIMLTVAAISLLYLNVLSFGPVMISYLISKSSSATLISLLRGVAVLVGLSATFTFNFFVPRLGLIRFSLWSIWTEILMLTIAISSFWIKDMNLSLAFLLIGTSLSRWGLYSFDITQTQLLQEELN